MNGYFTRLAQRGRGVARTLRPVIAPRFAADSIKADPIDEPNPQPNDEIIPGHAQPARYQSLTEHQKPQAKQTEKSPVTHPENQAQSGSPSQPVSNIKPKPEPDGKSDNQGFKADETVLIHYSEHTAKTDKEPIDNLLESKNVVATNIPTKTPPQPDTDAQPAHQESDYSDKTELLASDDTPLVTTELEETLLITDSRATDNEFSTNLNTATDQEMLSQSYRSNLHVNKTENQTINVTIGRVEVRAIQPKPVTSNPPKAKPKAILSLNEYLQQRSRGER